MMQTVHVRAPCRLHFGMFSFGHCDRPRFGGVGAMIDSPTVAVTISRAAQFMTRGEHSERVKQFAERAARAWRLDALPHCQIAVTAPPDHVGLGVGTQLGLSVAAGLRRFLQLPELPAEDLAQSAGRGSRSSVGTFGFKHGGLIVDGGKPPGESLGKLVQRIALPAAWRFVLIRCNDDIQGLAGQQERDAFAKLPATPDELTTALWQIVNKHMLPAVARDDCPAFGESVYRFGRLAGECFAPIQGGPFASDRIESLVEAIRAHGVPGVGQSSWGPTVFAIAPSAAVAESLADWLRACSSGPDYDITIAAPNNDGAHFSTLS